jgi:transcriptional regulator with XRE-family HTH domain
MSIEPTDTNFASRLVGERRRLKLTQAQAAEAGGVAKPTQIAYEQGIRGPGLEYLRRLHAAGFDLQYLVLGTGTDDFVSNAFRWDLLAKVHAGMNAWLDEYDVEVTAEKYTQTARVIYDICRPKGVVEKADVDRVMQLIAA